MATALRCHVCLLTRRLATKTWPWQPAPVWGETRSKTKVNDDQSADETRSKRGERRPMCAEPRSKIRLAIVLRWPRCVQNLVFDCRRLVCRALDPWSPALESLPSIAFVEEKPKQMSTAARSLLQRYSTVPSGKG
jgi:hypothetical protein